MHFKLGKMNKHKKENAFHTVPTDQRSSLRPQNVAAWRTHSLIWLILSYATFNVFYVAYSGRAALLRFALVAPIDGAGDGDA